MFQAGILTVSDRCSRGERDDEGGPLVAALLRDAGYMVTKRQIVPDEQPQIEAALCSMADMGEIALIITTGGTGFSPRDVTPEATIAVCDRLAPGISEAMRAESLKITPRGMLSRSQAGLRGKTLIVNLPGSPKAIKENLVPVLPTLAHGLAMLRGGRADCAAQMQDNECGHSTTREIPVFSLVSYSGTGKTTFLEKLLPALKQRGIRVAVVKHDAHEFIIDYEGKDSWRLTHAGADVTVLVCAKYAAVLENRPVPISTLVKQIRDVDLILTEGCKHEEWPKLLLYRTAAGKPPAAPPEQCFAVISDKLWQTSGHSFSLDDAEGVAGLLERVIRDPEKVRNQ